jgi:hypothetical protein
LLIYSIQKQKKNFIYFCIQNYFIGGCILYLRFSPQAQHRNQKRISLDIFIAVVIIVGAYFAMIFTLFKICVEDANENQHDYRTHQQTQQPQPTEVLISIEQMEEEQQILDLPPSYDSLFPKETL